LPTPIHLEYTQSPSNSLTLCGCPLQPNKNTKMDIDTYVKQFLITVCPQ
jgi:hypothetical protein